MHRYIAVKFVDKISYYCERYTLGKLLGSGSVPSPTALQKLLKCMDIYASLYTTNIHNSNGVTRTDRYDYHNPKREH